MTTEPLYVSEPEKWLKELTESEDLVCILFFRGSWCKYDRFYLRELGKYYKNTIQPSGESIRIIAWTSEGTEGAKKMDDELKLTSEYGFAEVIGDESNALAKYFKEFLQEEDILTQLQILPVEEIGAGDDLKKSTSKYPSGIALPVQLWYAHQGNLVLEWASTNKGGPGRPALDELWKKVLKRKKALEHGKDTMPAHGEMKLMADDLQVNLAQCVIL